MSEDRYRVLQDAITELRRLQGMDEPWRSTLCNVLQAILDRHSPSTSADPFCQWCSVRGVRQPWPCPDVLTVETALRNMKVLD